MNLNSYILQQEDGRQANNIQQKSGLLDRKSIVTWNDYLGRIKYFIRWLYNCRTKGNKENGLLTDPAYWETPSFVQIRKKKTKRLSPYSETEIWDRDEILSIVKYEPYKRL